MKISLTLLKLYFKKSYKRNDKLIKESKPMENYNPLFNKHYGKEEEQVFDIYYSNKEIKKDILMIDIHGGYYIGGRHKDEYPFAIKFLDSGIDVCLLEYRLNNKDSDTSNQLKDISDALNYITSNLENLGLGHIKKIFISGNSAGAHLALFNALAINNKNMGLNNDNIKLDGVILSCPSYDYASYRYNKYDNDGLKRIYLGKRYLEEGYLESLSPKTYIESLNIPLFVSTCTNDFLRANVLNLIEDLKKYSKDYTFVDIKSDLKNIGHVHNVSNPNLEESINVNNKILEFIFNH